MKGRTGWREEVEADVAETMAYDRLIEDGEHEVL